MLNTLYSIHRILDLELFTNILESNAHDIFYLHAGLLESNRLIIKNNDHIPELKKNELRIRNDLENLKYEVQKIKDNTIWIKQNNQILNVNEGIMIYLQKLQKKKFNMILMLLLNEFDVAKKNNDIDFLRKIKIFLSNFSFPKMKNLKKLDSDLFYDLNLNEVKKANPFVGPLFCDSSDLMNIVKNIFINYRPHKKVSYNPLFMLESAIFQFKDCLRSGLIGVPKSKRTQIATNLSEIITKTNEIVNKKDIYELQNVFRFEKEFNKSIKVHISLK